MKVIVEIVDIKDMPDFNPAVKNGIDSVSKGLVYLQEYENAEQNIYGKRQPQYPTCIRHGAMLKVSKDGIWRCGELSCSNGCYQTKSI